MMIIRSLIVKAALGMGLLCGKFNIKITFSGVKKESY